MVELVHTRANLLTLEYVVGVGLVQNVGGETLFLVGGSSSSVACWGIMASFVVNGVSILTGGGLYLKRRSSRKGLGPVLKTKPGHIWDESAQAQKRRLCDDLVSLGGIEEPDPGILYRGQRRI